MNFKTVRRVIAVIFAAVCALGTPHFAGAATYIVTSTNDSGPGTLRAAIDAANTNAGPDIILFNIAGSGIQTLNLSSGLPPITDSVIIDGYSQPGTATNSLVSGNNAVLLIDVSGANASSGPAFQIQAPNCTIRGLAIIDWPDDAIKASNISGVTIIGNYIGLDADGVTVAGNNGYGIDSTAANMQIGGTTPDVVNVIIDNTAGGINITNGSLNVVQGNYIGVVGSAPAGMQGTAVTISGANSARNLIGGSVAGAGNYIAANADPTSDAIYLLNCSSNTIQGNFIGTDPTGMASFGDTANGIQINGGNYNTIGGLAAGAGNTIAFNAAAGVWVASGANNAILGNSIFFNTGLGIDLGPIGVQPNDSLDADTGANNLQNYSVITNSMCDGTNTVVQGTLDSTPSTMFRIEFYRNNVCDSTGYGQAKIYIGATNVITSASGSASFKVALSTGPIAGQYIAAIATDSSNNSSEISACSVVNGVQTPTILAPIGGLLGVLGQTLVLSIDAAGTQSLNYQWRLNGTPIPGATNAVYTILSLAPANAGAYSVVVYNGLGAAHSDPAVVGILGLLQVPMTDDFADRGTFNGLSITASGNNVGATTEVGEPMPDGKPGGKSMWVTWVPTLSGVATVSTVGSSFDTLLAVYRGNSLTGLTNIVSDDESGGFHTSLVKFNVTGGTPYIIQVDGASGQSGNIILNCSVATLVSVASVTQQPLDKTVGTNMSASFSVDATGSSLAYQWYFNGTALNGATGWTYTLNSVTPSAVGVYQVKVQSGSQIIFGTPAQLQINYSDTGIDSNARAYDKLADAVFAQAVIAGAHYHTMSAPARGFSGTQIFSTYNSTQDPGEPENCGVPGGASSWFAYQPPYNGLLTIDTDGSTFDTLLGVYTGDGNDFSTLVSVACDNNSGTNGRTSKVVFNAIGGTTYWIAVDGVNGAYGTVYLHYNLATLPIFTADPSGGTVSVGGTTSLNANVTGNPTSKYQWMHNQTPVSGQTNLMLSFTNFQTANEGNYQLMASNSMGIVTSATAQLLVNSPMRMGSCCFSSNGQFEFELVGSANSNYVLQASSDLVHWQSLATNSSPSGLWNFSDPGSGGTTLRFYRAITQ